MTEEKVEKAEWPLNYRGLGYNSTLAAGPFFKEDVGFNDPVDNYRYNFCGACAFYYAGRCEALEEEVNAVASCELYISEAMELELRWTGLVRQELAEKAEKSEESTEDLEIVEEVDKYISREKGKYCVRSHQTGKSFGCYGSLQAAKKRLAQISRFKDESNESTEFEVKFASVDEDKKIVYGIVLEPDEVDAHGDTVTMDEIEKAAHKYALTPMIIGEGHTKKTKAKPIETFIYNPTVLKDVKEGSWVMAIKVYSDSVWEGIKDGSFTGLSIGAMVKRQSLEDD